MGDQKIGIYGTGKVATSFGNHLQKLGYEVGYYGRSMQTFRSQNKMVFDSWNSILEWADYLGFVVTDAAITEVSREAYAASCGEIDRLELPAVFHMSGALDVGALEGNWPYRFSLHPLRAFADAVEDLNHTVFVLEQQKMTNQYDKNKGEEIRLFVDSLGGTVMEIRSQHKVQYHLSAVIASNFAVSLMHFAKRYLALAGIEEERVLWPLVDSTIENMKRLGIDAALTGPINRGDLNTIKKHIACIGEEEDAVLYAYLSKEALALSQADDTLKNEVRQYLDEVLQGKSGER